MGEVAQAPAERARRSDPVVVVADGGGTKTDIAVLDLAGHVRARTRVGAFHPQYVGAEVAGRELDRAITRLLDPLGNPPVAVAGIYLSGLDFQFEIDAIRAVLIQFDWAQGKLITENDLFAVLRAGTDQDPAIAVICGTGTNCIGRWGSHDVRFAALGELSGDWGGGWSLGNAVIWHAARAADGRGPATALECLLLRHLEYPSLAALIEAFHRGEEPEEQIPALAPLVFRAADLGDQVARQVVTRQAEEIAAFVVATVRRLGIEGLACPVVLGGGVVEARHPFLTAEIERCLAEQAPGTYPVVVAAKPILGAALLALTTADAPSQALETAHRALS